MTKRQINDILLFREDISPFLVHLTRDRSGVSPKQALESIVKSREIRTSDDEVSAARFGIKTYGMSSEDKKRFFSAACLTETPLNEVHCLLNIASRRVNLSPYGLVFIKDNLAAKVPISPVIYLNNELGNQDVTVRGLCSLIKTDSAAAEEVLPLVSSFGRQITAPGATPDSAKRHDFRWEREWRLPAKHCPLKFDESDLFVGLCPDDEITHFEGLLPGISFIDPLRNMKWYSKKLVAARKQSNLQYSVV